MACGNQEYFIGNGPVYIRRIGDDCASATEGWVAVGDANELMINISQDFGNHYESLSGNKVRAARWLNQTDTDFSLSIQNFSVANLTKLLQGTEQASVVSASVTLEQVTNVYEGEIFFTANPGISSIVVRDYNGGTPVLLVEDVDYTIVEKAGDTANSSRDGAIQMITGAPNVVSSYPMVIEVDYDHVGTEGAVKALTSGVSDYEVKFSGINRNATSKNVVVDMFRAQFNATEELSLIGDEITSLSFTGALLPDGNGEFFTVTKVNAVS